MDEQEKEKSFEEQLAELIKQSGGSVPPKKNPPPVNDSGDFGVLQDEPSLSDPIGAATETFGETTETENATIETDDAAFIIPPENDTVAPKPEPVPDPAPSENTESPRHKTPEEIEAEIEAMILATETQAAQNAAKAEAETETGAQPLIMPDVSEKETDDGMSDILAQIEELEASMRADREKAEKEAAQKKAAEPDVLDEKLDELLRGIDEAAAMEEPSSGVDKKAEPETKPEPEIKQESETVPEPEVKVQPSIEIVPEKVAEDTRAISEIEMLKAKIASLEFLLSQKAQEKPAPQEPPPAPQPPPQPAPAPQVNMTAANLGLPGDVNAMFKQWFDLEMAAKMKNIIGADGKGGEKSTDKPTPPVSETETPPDMIKLSDNVFYSLKDKKTYTLKELSPNPELPPPRKRVVKKKPPAKNMPRPRRGRRRPGMRPRRRPVRRPIKH